MTTKKSAFPPRQVRVDSKPIYWKLKMPKGGLKENQQLIIPEETVIEGTFNRILPAGAPTKLVKEPKPTLLINDTDENGNAITHFIPVNKSVEKGLDLVKAKQGDLLQITAGQQTDTGFQLFWFRNASTEGIAKKDENPLEAKSDTEEIDELPF